MVIIEAVENDDDVIEKEASLNGVNNPPSQSSWSSGEAGVSRFYHQFASAAQTLNSCGGVTTVSHDNNNVFKASNFTSCGNPPNGSYSMVLEQQKQQPLSMTSLSDSNNNSSVGVGGSCFTPRGREDSISEPLRCVFCLERTEKLRQMLCLHSICNVCIEGSPKGSDVCPVCQKPGFTPNESSNHVGSVLSLFGDEGTTNTSDLLPPHSSTPLAMTSGVKGRAAAEETTPIKSSSSSGGGGGGGTPHSTTASVSLSSSGTHASSSSSVSGGSRATCTSCEDGSPTFAHCKDCNEALCSSCTYAHGRVKLTKEHRVEYVGSPTTGSKVTAAAANAALTHDRSLALTPRSNDSRSPVLSQGHHHSEGSPLSPEVYTFKNQPRCERHKHLPVTSLCRHCRLLCCEECLRQGRQQHDRHDVIPLHKMLHQVHATRGLIQQANKVLAAQFDERFRAVEAETRHYFDRMHKIIEQRAKSILDNLKTIKNTAMDDSARREEQLDDTLLKFELILSSDGNSGNHSGSGRKNVTANQLLNSSGRQQQQSSEVAKWVQRNHNNNLELSQDISLDQLTTEVSDLMTCCESLSSWSSDSNQLLAGLSLAFDGQLNFLWRNCDQLGAVATLIHHCGEIQSATCASKCEAYGLSSSTAIVGKTSSIYIQTYDFLSRRRRTGGSHMTAFLLQPGGAGESGGNCPHNRKDLAVIDRNNGVYEISYTPVKEGVHTLRVLMAGADVGCSPLRIHVIRTRSYSNIHLGQPKFIIGKEGNGDGDFCRPWGICCDNSGLIYVADRSNNRIQVFDSQGLFKFKFGQPGNKWGEFDRPASVAVDEHQGGRIVVADKDNHRIQIFERSTGKYLLKFGDKGVKPGQFNYPWDVAVNSKSEILVSDTRNHRLQLFTPEGIMKFVYSLKDAQMPNWQELFDSPRGVCFTPNDDIVCTDFNKHRAVCISSTFEKANYFSQEGDKKGDLKRPQGVCVDPEGHIIIADSRNHRIQAFTQQGVSVGMWGEQGNGLSQLDRPSGICVSPTGLVLVVDFGNSRVVAY